MRRPLGPLLSRCLVALLGALMACSDDASTQTQAEAPDAQGDSAADPPSDEGPTDASDPSDDPDLALPDAEELGVDDASGMDVPPDVDVSPDVDDASGVDVSPDADVSPDVDVPDGPPAIGAWSALPPLPRGPRQENAVLALDGALYVLGGFQGLQVSPLVEVYEPALGRWRDGEALPTRMHHLNAAVWEGQLYVLGFLTETSFTPDGRAFRYDPQEGVWSPLASMPRGAERGAGVAAALGERIYVVGGLRGGAVADVSAYDPASDTWSARAPLPEPLDHLVGGVVGGTLMVAGGRDGGLRSHTSALYAYDPRADRWEAKTPMPTSRAGHAAAVWDGRLYVFGGEGNPDDPSGVFPQTEVYDPANDTWSPLAPMPTPRHGTGAATLGATLYVPGGADVQGFGAVDTFEAFMPAPR